MDRSYFYGLKPSIKLEKSWFKIVQSILYLVYKVGLWFVLYNVHRIGKVFYFFLLPFIKEILDYNELFSYAVFSPENHNRILIVYCIGALYYFFMLPLIKEVLDYIEHSFLMEFSPENNDKNRILIVFCAGTFFICSTFAGFYQNMFSMER